MLAVAEGGRLDSGLAGVDRTGRRVVETRREQRTKSRAVMLSSLYSILSRLNFSPSSRTFTVPYYFSVFRL